MSDTPTPLSAEEIAVLTRLARHEETGVTSGFAHRRALPLPPGSATLSALVRDGLADRWELLCGTYYRITPAGHGALRKLDPAPAWRARR